MDRHRSMWRSAATLALALALLPACGGGAKDAHGGGGRIQVRGTFGAGITLASATDRAGGIRAAAAGGGAAIDNVVAADTNGHFILASKAGSGFTLSLPAGELYLIAFLSGTTTRAIYQADPSGAGWIALPVSSSSHDVDLGTLTFDATGVGTGTTPPAAVAGALGVDPDVARVIALWDVAMQRLANVDVDGNGTFDFLEGRQYGFGIHYEFDPALAFADVPAATLSDPGATRYIGYGYDFAAPAAGHDWRTATLTAPAAITPNGGAAGPVTPTCFASAFGGASESVNFYCGSGSALGNIAIAPVQPPAGDYVVSVDGGAGTYTFRRVASQTIDANLYDVYVPAVRLARAGGQVAHLDVQWWKRTASTGWVQATAAELAAVMVFAGFEVGAAGWGGSTADRVSGKLAIAPASSATVPAQAFTPGALRISYRDAFGYGYGFEWR